ncbi:MULTISPECIES: hypothetical protein [Parafrankia]|uniref:hypothetical protein n=1 Tax=Parafrankia TaxID=2994362 RepID=UPI001F614769|nr:MULTISPECIES: hypothetical protein [Parafrankia]
MDSPFDLAAFLIGHGFWQVRTGPDLYRHGRVEVENTAGHLHVRRHTAPGGELEWACTFGPGTPAALIRMGVLAAFAPLPVTPDDGGDWSVWAATPIRIGAELSYGTARAATRWLQIQGWPYVAHAPGATPPTGEAAPPPHIP